jgi:hypothetical protein
MVSNLQHALVIDTAYNFTEENVKFFTQLCFCDINLYYEYICQFYCPTTNKIPVFYVQYRQRKLGSIFQKCSHFIKKFWPFLYSTKFV